MEPPTPYLLVNSQIVERNLVRLAEYAQQYELDMRPHTKTHKSLLIAQMQIVSGAYGLTAAKVGEAETMARVCDDLLLAYPALDRPRADRLAKLARHHTVRIAVDSRLAAETLAAAARAHAVTLGILVDLDVGLHRTGVQSPDQALALAQFLDKTAGLRLDGLFFYPGHITSPPDAQEEALVEVSNRVAETLDIWGSHGLEASIVSGGSTPTLYNSHLIHDLTEVRPGTYVYNDMNTVHGGHCTLDDVAARIICTVVSNAVPGQVVIDAGSKTLSSDRCGPAPDSGFGYVVEYPDAKIVKLSEEHGQVDVSACSPPPQLGEQIAIIPNHICPCINLQDAFYWLDSEQALQRMTVDARGKLS